ncbi:protein FAM107B [Arctopsyche grandis]|uniref:protein FAM107B n=1 Tax=Arctopsyche grandis TaxID=121162 RepID=UPI00406D6CF0
MVLSDGTGGGVGGPVTSPGGAGDGGGLIAPRRLINPCLESSPRQDLHRELMFNQKIGKNVLNQKSELERALSKHKEKQVINQEKDQKEAPELARAIADRARRLEESMSNKNGMEKMEEAACNPQYIEARARLRQAK